MEAIEGLSEKEELKKEGIYRERKEKGMGVRILNDLFA